MDNSKMKEGRFIYEGCLISCYESFTLKGRILGREVNITINMTQDENYIKINLANQILIPKPNIIEKEYIFRKKQYEIKELQVTIDDEYIFQFDVTTMYVEETDIILGLPWFKKLGMEKMFVTFPYKKKMVTFQETTMKLDSILPSSKYLKYISKVILQENRWSL